MNTVIETLKDRLGDLNNELSSWSNPTEIMLNDPSLGDDEISRTVQQLKNEIAEHQQALKLVSTT